MAGMKNMTQVYRGKITLEQIVEEVRYHCLNRKKPLTRLVIDIVRRKDGYYTKIHIPTKDFKSK